MLLLYRCQQMHETVECVQVGIFLHALLYRFADIAVVEETSLVCFIMIWLKNDT